MSKIIYVKHIFWLGYILIIMGEMFNNITPIIPFIDFFTYFGLSILLGYIFIRNESYTKKIILSYILLLGFCLFLFMIQNDFTILKLLLLLLSLKNTDFQEFVKGELKIRIVLFIVVFLCCVIGLCGATIFVREDVMRYSLGFIHPNTTGFYMFLIGLEYIYVNRDNLQYKKIFVLIFLGLAILYITNSRTAFYSLILAIIGVLYVKNSRRIIINNCFIKFCLKHMFLIITLLTFGISYLYTKQNSIAILVDELFSYRLKYFSYFINNYSISLMGNNLTNYFVLDSMYLQLILKFGLVAYLFYYVMFFKRFDFAYKGKDYILIIIMFVMLCYGITENAAFKPTFNIFLLSFSDCIFNKKEVASNE